MPAIFSWQAFLIAAAPQPNVGALKMMKGASYEKPNNRASPDGNAPLLVLRTTSPKGKHVTGFSGRFTPQRIQFLCHPGGGSSSGAIQ